MSAIRPENKDKKNQMLAHMPEIISGFREKFSYSDSDIITYSFHRLYHASKDVGLTLLVNNNPESTMGFERAMEYAGYKQYRLHYFGSNENEISNVIWGKLINIPDFPFVRAILSYCAHDLDKPNKLFWNISEYRTGFFLTFGDNSIEDIIQHTIKRLNAFTPTEQKYNELVDSVIQTYGVKNE